MNWRRAISRAANSVAKFAIDSALQEVMACYGFLRILKDRELSQLLIQRGLENAKRFSWRKSAEILDEIIEKEVGP